MHHFFVEEDQIEENSISIIGDDVKHIKNVLRMKPQEKVTISSGSGRGYQCVIRELGDQSVVADIEHVITDSHELPSRIYLFQGLPKSDKMDLIVQKAVELGVYQIIPVKMKRSVSRLDAKKEAAKIKRWNKVAESAAKQSKRFLVPEIVKAVDFVQAAEMAGQLDNKFLPYELAEGMAGTREKIGQIRPGGSIGILIGPEGGFEPEEVELARTKGVSPITLGKRILRTETAGLAILSVLMFQLDEG